MAHLDACSLMLPVPPGQYGVGTINVELRDPSRMQLRGTAVRRWMTTVFYPTKKTSRTFPYMFGTLDNGMVHGTKVRGHACPNAPIIDGQKFPLIIALPGRGGERQKYSILYEALASCGYIVITMDQPYVANFVKFTDKSKITVTSKDLWYVSRDRDYRYAYDDTAISAAMNDIDFALNNLAEFNQRLTRVDLHKIVLMGHSIGGNIAHIKGFKDSRMRAIVDIDSKITEREVYGQVGVPPNPQAKPVLFIRGMLQYQEDVGGQLKSIANSVIWSPAVQHSAFSDDAYFAAKIPGFGMNHWQAIVNWLFKTGPYFSAIDTGLGSYHVDVWFSIYPQTIVKWLNSIFTDEKTQL